MSVVRGTALANYPSLVAGLGGDPATLLRAAGVRDQDVGNYDAFISIRAAIRAIESAAAVTATMDFGNAPLAVHLPHDPLTPEAFYLQYFGCRPYFAERVGGFTMRTADLSRPLNRDDVAHRVVVDYLSSITPLGEGIVESVRTIVRQLLPTGAATLNVVAEQFHLHPKTLQRRLAEENTTFVILVDRVRKDVADRYLRTTGIGLTHLARELGYAEQSVLTRSCKRWFGTGPAAYRNQARLQTTVSAPGSGRGPNPGNVSVSC